ncbi:hypothetical protein Tco_1239855 [Tanacetum coccineum]
MEDILSKFMSESAKRHEENSNLIKEIRASTDAAIRNQGASIKTLEIQIGQMSKVLQERGFGSLPSSTKANLRDQVKSISTTIGADSCLIRHIGSSQYAVSTRQNRTLMYETRQTTISFPSRLNEASISVMPLLTYLNLGLGELAHTKLTVELADRTVKYLKGIVENVLVGIGKFVFPVDVIILDMPDDIKVPLILGRPFLSTARAKIDVYKRKITLRVMEERIIFTSVKLLRRNQGDDLMPTIEEDEVIEEFRTRDDELDAGINDYPSYCNYDKKIHIDYKMVYKGNNVIGDLMNVPIFVGTFSVMTDFAVLENMDAYRDDGMGDVIFGEPFLREVGIKTRRFKGMITIYNGNDEVTYQMVRSHLRFKHHTNEQCNKIPPLLKVSKEDKTNEISHPYQKLKGFYKGVLNLGLDYIRDAKMEEWLTRGHISVHKMEW